MATKTTFIAITDNGATWTRTSGTMDYTHALQTAAKDGARPGIYSWHKSEAAAIKAAGARYVRENFSTKVLEVTGVPSNSPEAKAAVALDPTKVKATPIKAEDVPAGAWAAEVTPEEAPAEVVTEAPVQEPVQAEEIVSDDEIVAEAEALNGGPVQAEEEAYTPAEAEAYYAGNISEYTAARGRVAVDQVLEAMASSPNTIRELDRTLAEAQDPTVKAHLYRLRDILSAVKAAGLPETISGHQLGEHLAQAAESLATPEISAPLRDPVQATQILEAAAAYQLAHTDYLRIVGTGSTQEDAREARRYAAQARLRGLALTADLDPTHGLVTAHSYALATGSRGCTHETVHADGTSESWTWPPAYLT